jgi:hypothetical protein
LATATLSEFQPAGFIALLSARRESLPLAFHPPAYSIKAYQYAIFVFS